MNSNDIVRDRIEAAERMLHHARQQHSHGNPEDTAEFLAAAARNIGRAQEVIKNTASGVPLQRKEATA